MSLQTDVLHSDCEGANAQTQLHILTREASISGSQFLAVSHTTTSLAATRAMSVVVQERLSHVAVLNDSVPPP